LKVVFAVTNDAELHRQNFEAVKHYLAGQYRLEIDEACKNVERLCFVSYDPEAKWKAAVPLEPLVVPKTKKETHVERGRRESMERRKGESNGHRSSLIDVYVEPEPDHKPVSAETLRSMLEVIPADGRELWMRVLGALKLWD